MNEMKEHIANLKEIRFILILNSYDPEGKLTR